MGVQTEIRYVSGIEYHLERKTVKRVNLRIKADGTVWVSAARRVPARFVDEFVESRQEFIRRAAERFREKSSRKQPVFDRYDAGENMMLLGRKICLEIKEGNKESVRLESDPAGFSCLIVTQKQTEDQARRAVLVQKWLKEQQVRELTAFYRAGWNRFQEAGRSAQAAGALWAVQVQGSRSAKAQGVRPAETQDSRPSVFETCPRLKIRTVKTYWGCCRPLKGEITLNGRLLEAPGESVEYVVLHELVHLIYPNHSAAFYRLLTELMPDWKERRAKLESIPL